MHNPQPRQRGTGARNSVTHTRGAHTHTHTYTLTVLLKPRRDDELRAELAQQLLKICRPNTRKAYRVQLRKFKVRRRAEGWDRLGWRGGGRGWRGRGTLVGRACSAEGAVERILSS